MRNSAWAALFGVVAIAAAPADASTGTFAFTSTNSTGNSYGDVLTFAPAVTGGTDTLAGNNVTNLLIAAAYNGGNNNDTFKVQDLTVTSLTATPEPATFGLIGIALAGVGLIARRRRKR